MNTAPSVHRARSVNWPLTAFVVAHLAVVLPAVLLIPIFAARLPADAVKVESYSIVTDIVFVGIFLLRIALQRDDRAVYAVETALPLTLGYAGTGFFVIAGNRAHQTSMPALTRWSSRCPRDLQSRCSACSCRLG